MGTPPSRARFLWSQDEINLKVTFYTKSRRQRKHRTIHAIFSVSTEDESTSRRMPSAGHLAHVQSWSMEQVHRILRSTAQTNIFLFVQGVASPGALSLDLVRNVLFHMTTYVIIDDPLYSFNDSNAQDQCSFYLVLHHPTDMLNIRISSMFGVQISSTC